MPEHPWELQGTNWFQFGSVKSAGGTDKTVGSSYGISVTGAAVADEYLACFSAYHPFTTLNLYLVKTNNSAIINIFVDDKLRATNVDLYAPSTTEYKCTLVLPKHVAGRHTVKLVVTGKNASSTDYAVYSRGLSILM